VSHPSLGLPPRNRAGGFPGPAAAVGAARDRLAARAFEAAVDADPSLRERHDDLALRRLLDDTGTKIDVLASAVASGDADVLRRWADQAVPPFRRRGVPMDDLETIANAVRSVVDASLPPDAFAVSDAALDGAIQVFRWHRRIGGDARRRNKLLAFLYKGA
jgi:predicted amidohydrolase YtcJ